MKLVILIIATICLLRENVAQTTEESLNQFSFEFLQLAAKKNYDGNSVTSPASVSALMSMVASGANGKARDEWKSVAHLSDESFTKTGIPSVIEKLNNQKYVQLHIANQVFAANDLTLEPSYQKQLKTNFQADVKSVNFKDVSAAVDEINQWTSTATNQLIKEIVTSNDVDENTSLFLVNAVYFKGNWKTPFSPEETTDRPFHVTPTVTKQVPTMFANRSMESGYLYDFKSDFVLLEYEDGDNWRDGTYMFVILPETADDYQKLEKNMHKLTLNDFFITRSTNVELSLPKFTIESTTDVADYLTELGASELFSSNADFSGITKDRKIQINKVIQKAFIEVSEKGTEGGAATGGGFSDRISGPANIVFTVDRPFFVVIATNDVIIFTAKITDPSL